MLFFTSRMARRNGAEAEFAREALAGSSASGVPVYRKMIPRVAAELRRSRRYEHPLAVLALAPNGLQAGNNGNGRNGSSAFHSSAPIHSAHLAFFFLGSLLRDTLRESDIVTYAAEDHLYVVFLPESGEPEARQAARRFSQVFYSRVPVHLRIGVAEFPRDGFTVEDLFGRARAAWKDRPVTDELLPTTIGASNA